MAKKMPTERKSNGKTQKASGEKKEGVKKPEYKLSVGKPTKLLLSYTYPLNDTCSKHISIGFSPKDFSVKVLLTASKNSSALLDCTDWIVLQITEDKIGEFFYDDGNANQYSTTDSSIDGNTWGQQQQQQQKEFLQTAGKKIEASLQPCCEGESFYGFHDTFDCHSSAGVQNRRTENILGTANISVKKHIDIKGLKHIVIQNTKKSLSYSKIVLNQEEWEFMRSLVEFFNSIIYTNKRSVHDISEYYNTYIYYCICNNVKRLKSEQLFAPLQNDGTQFNYSRLFYEIPIILSQKVKVDVGDFKDELIN